MKQSFRKFLGDKNFYRKVFLIGVPIMLQQFLMQGLGLVDTLMVGSIERGVASVGLAVQFEMIMSTITFGICSGVCVFIAQFYGSEDHQSMKKCFSLMILFVVIINIAFVVLGLLFGRNIILFYNQDPQVVELALSYFVITLFGYIPSGIAFCYAFTYRNIQKSHIPMYVSLLTMTINVLFNYFLIFGIAFFPKLGVSGAAVATLLSNVVSAVVYILYSRRSRQIFEPKWLDFKNSIKKSFVKPVFRKIFPLMFNETLFGVGTTLYVLAINKLGTNAYEGYRMAESIVNIMFVFTTGLGSATSAMIGQELGAGRIDKAKSYGNYFIGAAFFLSIFLVLINTTLAVPLVGLFNNPIVEVTQIAVSIMYVFSFRLLLRAFIIIVFSTLRAGGELKKVLFLDAGLMYIIGIPLAFILTAIGINDIVLFYLILQVEAVVRVILGLVIFYRYRWLINLTKTVEQEDALCLE